MAHIDLRHPVRGAASVAGLTAEVGWPGAAHPPEQFISPLSPEQMRQLADLAEALCCDTFGEHTGGLVTPATVDGVGRLVAAWGQGASRLDRCPHACDAAGIHRIVMCEHGAAPCVLGDSACAKGSCLCIPLQSPSRDGRSDVVALIVVANLSLPVSDALCLAHWVQSLVEADISRLVELERVSG